MYLTVVSITEHIYVTLPNFRTYFELKRKKVDDCKRDELLGLRICKKREKTAMEHSLRVSILLNFKL